MTIQKTSIHAKRIKNKTGYEVAVLLEKPSSYIIKKMIEERNAFITVDKQMYIPFLAIHLKQSRVKETEAEDREKFTAATQLIFLYMLYSEQESFKAEELMEKLKVSSMTVNRTMIMLKQIGIILFLTHAHPDHIGTAAWFKEQTGCKIYASREEKRWIEDIDLQFKERPILNFYVLAGKSVEIDYVVSDGDTIQIDDDLCIQVMGTPGHSADEVSYQIRSDVFIGDSIPVKGDIPIYVNKTKSLESMKSLAKLSNAENYYPAWDKKYSKLDLKQKVMEAEQIIESIDMAVIKIRQMHQDSDVQMITADVAKLFLISLIQKEIVVDK